jgi:surface protein
MFFSAKSFNQPLNDWDVRKVTNMDEMFFKAIHFNQPLHHWKVHNVTSMIAMFTSAKSFNQPLDTWDITKVKDMKYMFRYATSFNQPLVSTWETTQTINETDVTGMFDSISSSSDANEDDSNHQNKSFNTGFRGLHPAKFVKNVKPTDLIIDIKESIEENDGIPTDQFFLSSKSKLYEDYMTVSECGIVEFWGGDFHLSNKKEFSTSLGNEKGFQELFTYTYGSPWAGSNRF